MAWLLFPIFYLWLVSICFIDLFRSSDRTWNAMSLVRRQMCGEETQMFSNVSSGQIPSARSSWRILLLLIGELPFNSQIPHSTQNKLLITGYIQVKKMLTDKSGSICTHTMYYLLLIRFSPGRWNWSAKLEASSARMRATMHHGVFSAALIIDSDRVS